MIIPFTYFDGIPTLKDSDITGIYERLALDGTAQSIFRDGQVSDKGQFLAHIKSGSVMAGAMSVGGIAWLNRIEKRKAHVHFAIFKEHWGKRSVSMGIEWVKYFMDLGIFDMFWGLIPSDNKKALRWVEYIGGHVVQEEIPCAIYDARIGSSVSAKFGYFKRG